MYKLTLTAVFIFCNLPLSSVAPNTREEPIIYLLPGTGADCRLFNKINFPFDTVHLEFPIPEKKTSMQEYANSFIPRIDTNRSFILMGVSLGGMICSELADTLSPEKVIVISGAKCRHELPARYKFQKYIPLNRLAPKKTIKWGSKILPLLWNQSENRILYSGPCLWPRIRIT